MKIKKLIRTNEEWKNFITPQQYNILREKGIEEGFESGNWHHNEEKGKYYCIACGNLLFLSEDKYASGTGWPSFTKTTSEESIESMGMDFNQGVEIRCKRCEWACRTYF